MTDTQGILLSVFQDSPFGFGHLIGTFFIPSETSLVGDALLASHARSGTATPARDSLVCHVARCATVCHSVPQCASHCNSVQHTASVTLHLSVMWPGLPGSEVLPPFSVCTIGLPASQTRCCCSSKDQTRITALVFTFDPQPVSLRTPVIIST